MTVHKIDYKSLKKEHWTDTQNENAQLVVDFVQHIMNDHDFDYIDQRFGKSTYVQHNRNMKDGIDGVIQYLKTFVKSFPEFSYDIKSIMVDGDLVSIHSHATLKASHRGNEKKGLNIKDTWRVKDGQLVEHWDAVQAMDPFMRVYAAFVGGKTLNRNGVY